MKTINKVIAFCALTLAVASAPAMATTYKFTVSCSNRIVVDEWDTGAIDPGKEYLRLATGTANPGCSIHDYNPTTDSAAPVTHHSGAPGVVQGIPFVGPILRHILHI